MEERRRRQPEDAAGWALRKRREERGISARELSIRAGLSESYVGKLEAGAIDASLRCFARIAMALDLSPQEVFFIVRQASLSHPVVKVDR